MYVSFISCIWMTKNKIKNTYIEMSMVFNPISILNHLNTKPTTQTAIYHPKPTPHHSHCVPAMVSIQTWFSHSLVVYSIQNFQTYDLGSQNLP